MMNCGEQEKENAMQIKLGKVLTAVAIGATLTTMGLTGCQTSKDTTRTEGRVVDDKDTSKRVTKALDDNPLYKFPGVRVETYAGVVNLSGFVDTQQQKDYAGQIASQQEGVHKVVNGLVLKPTANANADIKNAPMAPTGYQSGQRMDATTQPRVNMSTNNWSNQNQDQP